MPASLLLPWEWLNLCTPQDLAELANWGDSSKAAGVRPPSGLRHSHSSGAQAALRGRLLSALVEVGGLIDSGLCRKWCWDFPLEPGSWLLWLFRRSEGRTEKILTKQPTASFVGLFARSVPLLPVLGLSMQQPCAR